MSKKEKVLPGFGGLKINNKEVSFQRLHLDVNNPRLSEEFSGSSEHDLLQNLFLNFDLGELADSMSKNGYFDEEPLIVCPKDLPPKFSRLSSKGSDLWKEYEKFIEDEETNFIVVEGNRRLATIKILLNNQLREKLKVNGWPEIEKVVRKDLENLPVIIYPMRESIMPYLGVRHITGIKKWESYSKARYIAGMKSKGFSIAEIRKTIGDRNKSTEKLYISYKLVDIMDGESEEMAKRAKGKFSYLILALGYGSYKDFLGMSKKIEEIDLENPVSRSKVKNLITLFSLLFGENKDKPSVITDSREITGKLDAVLRSKEATDYLVSTRNLSVAYEMTDGEEIQLLNELKEANWKLSSALGKVHRNKKSTAVKEEVDKCKETINRIVKELEK